MRSWVEVSLGRIRANFRAVREVVGEGVEVMPVVKADAYRHGTGVMTHFASSGNYESPQTGEQIARFELVLDGLRTAGFAPRYVHASSSIPIAYRRKEGWGNLVRPGHAIYGYVSAARGAAAPRAA